jgi:formylglycine-generating enzyme required for sulfatase activity
VKELGFFCPSDAQLKDVDYKSGLSKSMISLDRLFMDLDDSPAGVKLLLVDACRNELGTRSFDTDALKPARGIAALFSCAASQKSHESAKLGKGHGVFFHYVLEGLNGAARNEDGEVTWDDLTAYVKRQVPKAVRKVIGGGAEQSPHLVSNLVNTPVLVGSDTREITNSIGVKLVLIPEGTFKMGSPTAEKDRNRDEYQHDVKISKPFYLGVYTVTQKQYREVMGTNPSYFSKTGGGKDQVKDLDTDDFPVEQVSWEDADQFCKQLSALPPEKKAKRSYRLPTEAQWEYACRAGASTPFAFGKSLSSRQANFNGNNPYGGASKGPYLGRTREVRSYKPNAWGLFNMHGNVWQWCRDWYGEDSYKDSPKRDPEGKKSGTRRVMRGGSWWSNASNCRAANRSSYEPAKRGDLFGFRLVCVPAGKTP